MKRFIPVIAIFTLFAIGSADSLRSQIVTMNKRVDKAMFNRDMDGFLKVVNGGISKDFKYSEAGKSESYDQMVAQMRQGMAMMTKMTLVHSKVISVTEKGDSGRGVTWHTSNGVMMQGKKAHKVGFTGTSVETYRKVKGKWLMTSMSWKDQKMTMDGKAQTH